MDKDKVTAAQQFIEQYAKVRGFQFWEDMWNESEDWEQLEDDVMNAFAKAQLEEVRENLKNLTEEGRYSIENYEVDHIIDEHINKLK